LKQQFFAEIDSAVNTLCVRPTILSVAFKQFRTWRPGLFKKLFDDLTIT
jgi:hypothetical protein